jgi:hypothetical protein
MLVNARLLYISVDSLHYSLGGQVILTANVSICLRPLLSG